MIARNFSWLHITQQLQQIACSFSTNKSCLVGMHYKVFAFSASGTRHATHAFLFTSIILWFLLIFTDTTPMQTKIIQSAGSYIGINWRQWRKLTHYNKIYGLTEETLMVSWLGKEQQKEAKATSRYHNFFYLDPTYMPFANMPHSPWLPLCFKYMMSLYKTQMHAFY